MTPKFKSHRSRDPDVLRTDYEAFALAIHPDWDETYFQAEILAPYLEGIAACDKDYNRLIFTLPFRYSKTELCVETFIPFYFGHNPDHPVIFISYGKAISRKSGRAIREIMKSDLYVELFPESALTRFSRASDEFETVSGGKFFAGGFDVGVNGRGAKLLFIDDPHKNLQDVNSELERENVRRIYNSVVRTRCEPGAAIAIGGVRWTPSDMIGWRISEDGAWDEIRKRPYDEKLTLAEGPVNGILDSDDEGVPASEVEFDGPSGRRAATEWRVVRLTAEALVDEGWRKPSCSCGLVDKDGALVPHGEPLWPEHWPCQSAYDLKLHDPDIYEASYLLRPSIQGGYWFANYPPNFYQQINPKNMNIYMICDPSLGLGKKSDRTALGVLGLGSDQNVYLLDLVWGRISPMERMDHIFRLHRRWRPRAFGYEEYGAQADHVAIKAEQEKQNYRFPITILGREQQDKLWRNKDKPSRIRTMLPLAVSGRFWLPDPKSIYTEPNFGKLVETFIDREWNKYPAAPFDDCLDMLSRINDPQLNAKFPTASGNRGGPRTSGSSGPKSWMAA